MRVAQAIALYPPEFRGGATLVCERLAEELAARGHVVDVFSGRTSAAEPLGAVRRDPVGSALTWRVNLGGAFLPWSRENWDNDVAARSFASFLQETRPDVVHAHSVQALGIGVFSAAAAARVPVVWTMHDWWWLCPCLFRLADGRVCAPIPDPRSCSGHPEVDFAARRRALEAALRQVARVLVPSRYLRDSLVANGLDPALVAVQENAVPQPAVDCGFAAAPAQKNGALRAVFIGGAGNREKGLDVLLAAAARLADAEIELHLHCVDPDDAGAVAQGMHSRVQVHPRFEPGELDRVLASADVVVVPSLMRESSSLVTREALARGVPVVVSDSGGPEEVVRAGENGLIVPSGSPGALARALRRLAADRALLARLATAARPRLPTPAEYARAAEGIYREVLREAVRSPGAGLAQPAEHGLAGRQILFLVGIDGAPLRYRVWHLVEQLAEAGVASRVLYHSDVAAQAAAGAADLVVLYRAPFSATVAAVVGEARRRGVPVVFSVDDLVFSDGACDAPALRDPREEVVRGFRWTLDAYGRSFAAADAFLGSTDELVATARGAGKPAYLHRNGVGRPLLSLLDAARKRRVAADDAVESGLGPRAPLRLGFLSGTDTHDRDLAAIAPALRRTLERFPCLDLVVGGPVGVPAELEPFAARIARWPLVPWSDLADRLATLDLSLAPLELPNRFNEAKSEVKYLEAALAGVATIASPSAAFRTATRDGETGCLAGDASAWEAMIAHLVGDADARDGLARRARRDVVARYGPLVQGGELVATLTEILARGPGAARALPDPIEVDGGAGSSVALEPAAHAYDAYQLDAEAAAPLAAGQAIEQRFTCRRDGVWRVDVLVGTGWRRNRHDLVLSVLDDAGGLLGRRVVDAATLVDRTFVAVELERPLDGACGRELCLRAEAPGARPGEETSLWYAPADVGALRVGGSELFGRALAFRSFAEVV